MKRTPIDALITRSTLEFIDSLNNRRLTELLINDDEEVERLKIPVKNVCAKLSIELSDEIDNLVGLLSISKREFIEACIREGLDRAHAIVREEGVEEAIEQRSEGK